LTVRAQVDRDSGLFCVVDGAGKPVERINAFLRAVATRGLSALTVRAYAFDLVAVYRWLGVTGRTLDELTQADLLDFVAHERRRGAQPTSINRRLSACRMLHSFWYPRGLPTAQGTSMPAPYYRGLGRERRLGLHLLRKPRSLALRVKQPKKLVAPLPAEQVRQFLQGLRRYRDLAIVHLMLLCGLRSREVIFLKLGDVSVLETSVRVFGKGSKERVVPLAQLAAISIQQYFKHERPSSCASDVVFVCLQGKRRGLGMTPAGLRSVFRSHRKPCALRNANPHRFRHTFGTDMARGGVSLAVLQKLMGHSCAEQTLQYINLSLADVADAFRAAAAQIQKRYDLELPDAATQGRTTGTSAGISGNPAGTPQ
jgi:integrase/recombinase XerD